jgi:hypothetical protein
MTRMKPRIISGEDTTGSVSLFYYAPTKKIHAIIAAKCCKKKKSIMAKIENQKDCARTVKDEAK